MYSITTNCCCSVWSVVMHIVIFYVPHNERRRDVFLQFYLGITYIISCSDVIIVPNATFFSGLLFSQVKQWTNSTHLFQSCIYESIKFWTNGNICTGQCGDILIFTRLFIVV